MCLNCGCGEPNKNHGNPLNITMSRLRLIASRNNSTPKQQAANLLATVLGIIDPRHPIGSDYIHAKLARVSPRMKVAQYVEAQKEESSAITKPTARAAAARAERAAERER